MDELLASSEEASKKVIAGDTVKGTVISVKKHEILIDLGAQGVGLVPRREASFARNLNVGDEVSASVIEAEMDEPPEVGTSTALSLDSMSADVSSSTINPVASAPNRAKTTSTRNTLTTFIKKPLSSEISVFHGFSILYNQRLFFSIQS